MLLKHILIVSYSDNMGMQSASGIPGACATRNFTYLAHAESSIQIQISLDSPLKHALPLSKLNLWQ